MYYYFLKYHLIYTLGIVKPIINKSIFYVTIIKVKVTWNNKNYLYFETNNFKKKLFII